ncbi:MAG: hypothetical protein Q9220_004776 [cf. Caloplaca sp. 1 TL-2023]
MSITRSVDLWETALTSLSVEDQQAIASARKTNDNVAILAELLAIAEQKRQTCMQRRWKYTKRNGEIIILRDVYDKIVKWITKFKDIGDIAVQYDPAHASLPWAAIRLCLQVSVNDVQTFGAMAEGMELMARARHYYGKSTLRRLGASLVVTADAIEQCLNEVGRGFNDLEHCAHLIDRSLALDLSETQDANYQSLTILLASLEQPALRTVSLISDLHSNLKSNERRKLLSWLSTIRYREHHKTAYSTVMRGSGQWLQRKPAFTDWKTSSSSSTLWIHGIPGSGKSKLISTVIQDLISNKARKMATSAIAYFYCSRDAAETTRADPDEIMRAILKQLCCFDASQPIHAVVAREYEKRKRDADEDGLEPLKLSLSDCKDLIIEIAEQLPMILVIDALDECDPLKRHGLLQALRDIVRDSASLIKIMVSSRDDSDIVCRLANVPNVYINSENNDDDINRFIDLELEKAIVEQRLLQGRVPDYLKGQILWELKGGANGMFLWASLQIQNLCDPQRMIVVSDVEDALIRLPPNLSQLYDAVLDRVDRIAPRGRIMAYSALRWLLCARRPLNAETLAEMIVRNGTHVSKDDILSLCCNLVTFDEALKVFRFAHASVREFLEVRPGFGFEEINSQAAQECLHLVITDDWHDNGTGFSNYAVAYWVIHYRALDLEYRTKHALSTTVKKFLLHGVQNDPVYTKWANYFSLNRYSNECHREETVAALNIGIRPLHLACSSGLIEVIDDLTKHPGIQINECDQSGATSLYIAASNGHKSIVQVLLERGADNAICTPYQETVLHRAAEAGHKTIVQLLLDYQADVTVQDDQGWTALDWAAKNDHVEVVRLLISTDLRDEAIRKYGLPVMSITSAPDFLQLIHRPTGCIGIKNEGATGYLNAILHLLYTLQPFHDLLKSIPLHAGSLTSVALELLFTAMETSTDVVTTRDLIRAFGWESEQLQQPNDPIETFNTLMEHFHNLLLDGPFFATFQDLLWSQIRDLRGSRIEWSSYISVSIIGHRDLNAAMKEWSVDDRKDSPHFGLARWRYTVIVHRGAFARFGDINSKAKIIIFLKSHLVGRWMRCRNEHVTWATEEEVFEGNFGSDVKPERLITSSTAVGLIYLQTDRINELARVMVPYGG